MLVLISNIEKEIWDKIYVIEEETSKDNNHRVIVLLHDYEMLIMLLHESICDIFTHFNNIVTLHALVCILSNFEYVRKILHYLPKS